MCKKTNKQKKQVQNVSFHLINKMSKNTKYCLRICDILQIEIMLWNHDLIIKNIFMYVHKKCIDFYQRCKVNIKFIEVVIIVL